MKDEEECVICMDRKASVILPCAHAYCEQCIDTWSVLVTLICYPTSRLIHVTSHHVTSHHVTSRHVLFILTGSAKCESVSGKSG